MSDLQQLQQAMKGYILTDAKQIVPQISKPPRDEITTRLDIYANAYSLHRTGADGALRVSYRHGPR